MMWAGADEPNRASTPLRPRAAGDARLLVCHDMQGGYRQDRLPQGDVDTNVYRIADWQRIDVFVYFSHQLVTLPPPVWTNPAHNCGTRVLGTVCFPLSAC
jgi:mannosyl-glycoprotein endo-beta-N-acetylglucosaminidase